LRVRNTEGDRVEGDGVELYTDRVSFG
jgi:hypothetical protein